MFYLCKQHACVNSTFVNIPLLYYELSSFDGDRGEDMDSRWQGDCQRSPLESLKWQICSVRQSVLERGNNQSHGQKKSFPHFLARTCQTIWTFIL